MSNFYWFLTSKSTSLAHKVTICLIASVGATDEVRLSMSSIMSTSYHFFSEIRFEKCVSTIFFIPLESHLYGTPSRETLNTFLNSSFHLFFLRSSIANPVGKNFIISEILISISLNVTPFGDNASWTISSEIRS